MIIETNFQGTTRLYIDTQVLYHDVNHWIVQGEKTLGPSGRQAAPSAAAGLQPLLGAEPPGLLQTILQVGWALG